MSNNNDGIVRVVGSPVPPDVDADNLGTPKPDDANDPFLAAAEKVFGGGSADISGENTPGDIDLDGQDVGGSESDAAVAPVVDDSEPPATDENTGTGTNTGTDDTDTGTDDAEELPPAAKFQFNGQEYDETVIQQGIALQQWATSLPPQATQAIDAYLAGQAVLVPVEEWQRIQGQLTQPSSTPSPNSTPIPTAPPAPSLDVPPPGIDQSAWDYMDDATKQSILALNGKVSEIETSLEEAKAAQFQQQYVTERDHAAQEIDAGVNAFLANSGLSQSDVDRLVQSIGELQVYPSYAAKHNGDHKAAITEALNDAMYRDASIRDRIIRQQAEQEAERIRQEQAAIASRRQAASAVSGNGGGTTPTPAPVSHDPSTPQGITAMMADEIAKAMRGQET